MGRGTLPWATEEEFGEFDADPNAIMHVSIATSVVHARAKCDGCFDLIPLGEEHRYDISGVPLTYCNGCYAITGSDHHAPGGSLEKNWPPALEEL